MGTWEAAAAVLPLSGSCREPLLPSTAGAFTGSSAALRLRRRDTMTQMMATRASTRNAPSSDAIKGAASDAAALCAPPYFPGQSHALTSKQCCVHVLFHSHTPRYDSRLIQKHIK